MTNVVVFINLLCAFQFEKQINFIRPKSSAIFFHTVRPARVCLIRYCMTLPFEFQILIASIMCSFSKDDWTELAIMAEVKLFGFMSFAFTIVMRFSSIVGSIKRRVSTLTKCQDYAFWE